jgi:hypothetical protein
VAHSSPIQDKPLGLFPNPISAAYHGAGLRGLAANFQLYINGCSVANSTSYSQRLAFVFTEHSSLRGENNTNTKSPASSPNNSSQLSGITNDISQ